MSTAADIWEVMAEEIGERPADRGRELVLSGSGYTRYGTADTESTLLAAEIDPDHGVSGDAALAFACKHYDVPVEDVCNSRLRRTAVIAARVSVATRLAAAGWSQRRIARLLHTKSWNVWSLLRGGRGYGRHVASRVVKDLVARRPRRPPVRVARAPRNVVRRPPADQAVHTLRRLRAAGVESHFPRVLRLYFPTLNIDDVYARAFGPEPAPLTLDDARAAEARGEGSIRFVDGQPTWVPAQPEPTAP